MSQPRLCRLVTRAALWASLSCAGACSHSEREPVRAEATPIAPPTETKLADVPAPLPPAPPRPLLEVRRQIMSTWFEAKVANADDDTKARAALERALDEIARLEDVLSEWRSETEISRINAQAGDEPVQVSRETEDVIRAGLDVSTWSDGAFDLSWAAMRGLYKFEPGKPPVLPTDAEIERLKKLVGYRDIALDAEHHTVQLRRKGMAIGTGGIAKGYALDRASELLERAGYANYLLFAGGQVQVHGKRDGRAWRIGIKHPRKSELNVGSFELENGSVSTSGDYEHYFVVDGKLYHHIIDLSTGRPATKSVSVTLIAPQGVYADALSTACFVMGPERCLPMLEKLPFAPQAIIIDPEMRVHVSKGMEGKVHFNPPLVDGKLPELPAR